MQTLAIIILTLAVGTGCGKTATSETAETEALPHSETAPSETAPTYPPTEEPASVSSNEISASEKPASEEPQTKAPQILRIMYTTATVNIRSTPEATSKTGDNLLGTEPINTELKVIGETGDWSQLESYQGKEAYVKTSLLSKTKTEVKPEQSKPGLSDSKPLKPKTEPVTPSEDVPPLDIPEVDFSKVPGNGVGTGSVANDDFDWDNPDHDHRMD